GESFVRFSLDRVHHRRRADDLLRGDGWACCRRSGGAHHHSRGGAQPHRGAGDIPQRQTPPQRAPLTYILTRRKACEKRCGEEAPARASSPPFFRESLPAKSSFDRFGKLSLLKDDLLVLAGIDD